MTNLRILVVDDNPSIHEDFQKILGHENDNSELNELKKNVFGSQYINPETKIPDFIIDSAYQGEEALLYVKAAIEKGMPYALMFVDINMPPGWNGIETIRRIWEIDSDIQAVICTAHLDFSWSEMIKELGQTDRLHILKKPFDNIEILQFASSLTEKWKLRQQIKNQVDILNTLVRQQTAELKKSLSITKATLESTTDGIIVISNNGEIIDYNQKFINIWRVPLNLLKKRRYSLLKNYLNEQMKYPEFFLEKEQEVMNHNEAEFYQEIKLKNGSVIECYNIPHRMDNNVIGRVISFRDVTVEREIENQLQHLATFDVLTDLPNRTLLLDRIRQATTIADRTKTMVGVLFIDIDQFKNVNDSLGHSVGDKLLKELARRLTRSLRELDTTARFGGDEFVVVLQSMVSKEDITAITKKLLSTASCPYHIDGHELRITCSIGVSLYPDNGCSAETLLKNADIAMYRVKTTGRNNFKFYTKEMNATIVKRLQLETNLFRALENNEFCLQYQPIFDLRSGKIISTEALLRWQHPKLGLLLPSDFISICEEVGLIVEIGKWVLKTACNQNKILHEKNLVDIPIAVNLSSYQLHHSTFVETISKTLVETKLDPKYLELELTESIIIDDTEAVIQSMHDINSLGVSIIIDDFGTGYSSLSYLRRLPISKLKIDKSFIEDINVDPEDVTVILAIINLAHNLNMKVIGEGVETKEQQDFLKFNNCDEVQGYFFCQPLFEEEYITFLTSHKL